MPSSKKKNSKPPTRLSNGERTASPQSVKLPPSSNSELSEENLLDDAIAQASGKYPHLIGKSASIGRITDVETNETIGCKIWMSEPYMVASSIVPGSTVSVSLASSRNESSNGFPISSFSSEYAQNTGFDVVEKMPNEAGIYFALATVYSSSKVTGNGVRLSWQLSCTMGCPTPERSLFIFPVQTPASTVPKNGFDGLQNRQILFQNCKELCLELAAANEFTTNPPVRKSHNLLEERFPSSPRTPMHRSRISSPSIPFSSPSREESVANSLKEVTSVVDSVDTVKLLEDESTKKLLQTCASSFLYKRYLLQGNIVVLPLLPKLCIFRVVGARQVSDHQKIQVTDNESILSLSSNDAYDSDAYHAFAVTSGTKIYLRLPNDMSSEIGVSHAKHEDKFGYGNFEGENLRLGGLLNESTILKDIIVSSCLKNTMSSFGLRATKGVLLHGPPGTGKTCLARLCARDTCINFFCINGPEIVGQYHGESEQALREVFESAGRATPAVVFIDELDAIAPARKEGSEELSQRMVATLLTLMDGIGSSDGLLVISATNRPDSIEPALRRPGRFDREIEIGVPSPNQRLEILLTYLNQMDHNLSDAQIQQIALSTHGFVGADLAALCNEAALFCLRRYHKLKNSCGGSFSKTLVNSAVSPDGTVGNSNYIRCKRDLQQNHSGDSYCSSEIVSDDEIIQSASYIGNGGTLDGDFMLKIVLEDFEKARMKVRPSAMREVILEVPKVKWEDIGGLKEIKNQLMEAVEWPQKHQDALNRIGTRPPRGVLMFGPPGCSKTLMARAVASEAGLNFLAVKGPELFSKWVGESEKAVRSVFAKARANAPSIIFFDEIDGLAAIRGKESDGVSVSDRVMSQLLVELDGLQQRIGVTVIAATNRPDKIDSALLRPGRFDRLVYVGPPNEADRQEIFSVHLRKIPCSCNVDVKELGCLTETFTGADISLVCREAAIAAIEEKLDATEVTMRHLTDAIKQVRPSKVGESDYQELSGKFQRLVLSSSAKS